MRNAALFSTATLAFGLSTMACGGDVTSETDQPSSAVSSASATTGQGGASANSSVSAGGGNATSVATSTTTTAGVGGAGGGPPEDGCPAIAGLTLSNPALSDEGGDGTWSPDEDATFSATLSNPTAYDVNYPGYVFGSDNPSVTSQDAANTFFLIFAGSSMDIQATFHADAAVAPGTPVTLSITMVDIQSQICELPVPLTLSAVIQ